MKDYLRFPTSKIFTTHCKQWSRTNISTAWSLTGLVLRVTNTGTVYHNLSVNKITSTCLCRIRCGVTTRLDQSAVDCGVLLVSVTLTLHGCHIYCDFNSSKAMDVIDKNIQSRCIVTIFISCYG